MYICVECVCASGWRVEGACGYAAESVIYACIYVLSVCVLQVGGLRVHVGVLLRT